MLLIKGTRRRSQWILFINFFCGFIKFSEDFSFFVKGCSKSRPRRVFLNYNTFTLLTYFYNDFLNYNTKFHNNGNGNRTRNCTENSSPGDWNADRKFLHYLLLSVDQWKHSPAVIYQQLLRLLPIGDPFSQGQFSRVSGIFRIVSSSSGSKLFRQIFIMSMWKAYSERWVWSFSLGWIFWLRLIPPELGS